MPNNHPHTANSRRRKNIALLLVLLALMALFYAITIMKMGAQSAGI